jgi:hypothetical protein
VVEVGFVEAVGGKAVVVVGRRDRTADTLVKAAHIAVDTVLCTAGIVSFVAVG